MMQLEIWWHSLDTSPAVWGAVGGFLATALKHRQTKSLPEVERPDFSKIANIGDYCWNGFLGLIITHVYAISGNVLNPLGGLVTGGAAPSLLVQLFDAAAKQHLPGTKPTGPRAVQRGRSDR